MYLKEVYPGGATARTLRHYLNERGYPVAEKAFDFHARYLAEAGFVTYEVFPQDLGEPDRIRLVKATKAGIDKVDGRSTSSSGVRF